MKVGIVTLYDNSNFGNRLQNYALQEILKRYFDEVVTIKNRLSPQDAKDKLYYSTALGEILPVHRMLRHGRYSAFLAFTKKYIKMSKKCYFFDRQYAAAPERCDYYCAGSDQIWNPDIRKAYGFNYLNFSVKERNFSFAASFGVSEIRELFRQQVKEGLSHIGTISVREDAGQEIVRNLTGRRDVEVLIDPTMYLSVDEWSKIAKRPKAFEKCKYLLMYFLGDVSEDRKNKITEFANLHSMKIIDVMDSQSPFYAIGPDEFIFLIKNAGIVCTDSFHGSIFSFLFDIPLAVYKREKYGKNMESRIESLAHKFYLSSCIVSDSELQETLLHTDYRKGKRVLLDEKQKVNRFLESIFN